MLFKIIRWLRSPRFVCLPVNNAFVVKELEARNYFCAVKPGSRFIETTGLLNVKHEIATIQIFHNEEQMGLPTKNILFLTVKFRKSYLSLKRA
jgi:hypothetical protein